jgi:hypothetical protein
MSDKLICIRLNLISSILFAIGCTLWTISFLWSDPTKEWAVRLTYTAFGSLLGHCLFELYLDLSSYRMTIHGRYSDFPCLNIFLSIIFMAGVIGEALTYVMLSQQDDNKYNSSYQNQDDYSNNNENQSNGISNILFDYELYLWVSLISPHLFVLLSILSTWGRSCCVRGAGLDNIANTMFAIGALLFLFAGYWTFAMDETRGSTAEEESFVAKWTGVFIWDVAAFLYAGRDILKYSAYRSSSSRYRQRLYEEEEDTDSFTSGTYA